jgi:hypothetical protein
MTLAMPGDTNTVVCGSCGVEPLTPPAGGGRRIKPLCDDDVNISVTFNCLCPDTESDSVSCWFGPAVVSERLEDLESDILPDRELDLLAIVPSALPML